MINSFDGISSILDESLDLSQSERFEDRILFNNLNEQDYFEKSIGKYYLELWPKLEKKGDFFYCNNCNNLLLHFDNDSLSSLDYIVYSCKCTENKNKTIPINKFFTEFIKNAKDNENEI